MGRAGPVCPLHHDGHPALNHTETKGYERKGFVQMTNEPSVKAILARFSGDHKQAVDYCRFVASEHPRLREEYAAYAEKLEAPCPATS